MPKERQQNQKAVMVALHVDIVTIQPPNIGYNRQAGTCYKSKKKLPQQPAGLGIGFVPIAIA